MHFEGDFPLIPFVYVDTVKGNAAQTDFLCLDVCAGLKMVTIMPSMLIRPRDYVLCVSVGRSCVLLL